jgi:hypothetical protein
VEETRARGGVVVKALCYESVSRGFDGSHETRGLFSL